MSNQSNLNLNNCLFILVIHIDIINKYIAFALLFLCQRPLLCWAKHHSQNVSVGEQVDEVCAQLRGVWELQSL